MTKKWLWIGVIGAGTALIGGILIFAAQGKSAASHFAKAQEVAGAGNPAQVITLLEKAKLSRLKLAQRLEALSLLGKSYAAQGEVKKARKVWGKILAAPKAEKRFTELAQFELAILKKAEQPQEAQKTFTELASTAQDAEVAAGALLEVGQAQQKAGDLLAASESYKKILDQFSGSSKTAQAVQGIGDVNTQLLFSKIETPYCEIHVVKSGESLASIAKKRNITVGLLAQSNGVVGHSIRKGERLKVCTAKFSILIDKSQNTLTLKANEELFKVYPVGTGKEGSTPIGEFKVTNKLVNPTWYHPTGGIIPFGSKDNLLGTRWIGINSPGYGIHGTWEPDTVGKQSSAGCVRLLNDQVEELYKIITEGTPVTIVE